MSKFHIHIYEVKRKYEVDLEESDPLEAKKKAIEIYDKAREKLKEVDLDCRIIVLAFDEEGGD